MSEAGGQAVIGAAVRFDGVLASDPAAAWFRDALYVAYADAANELCLRRVDVRGGGATSVVQTGFTSGGHVAVAAGGHRLFVVFGEPGVRYELTSTVDGAAFEAPAELPISDGFVGSSGLTKADSTLAVLWAENAGGRAHLLRSDDGGSTWSDVFLPFAVQPVAALCWQPGAGCFVAAYGGRSGGPGSFTVVALDRDNPAQMLDSARSQRPTATRAVAICPTNYHNRPGLHLAFDDPSQGSPAAFTGRTFGAELADLGSDEAGPAAYGIALAHDGRHTWVAWTDASTRLWVGHYQRAFDLPQDLLGLLGQECDPHACPTDPRLVCEAQDEMRWTAIAARIDNAAKGDVIMTPGDGAGVIGTLLERLSPRQFFDHMGVMLTDHSVVRHATMAHDRLKERKPGRYLTGSVFGQKAPTDGFRSDVVKYGWPGTITQSVEDAFYTGFNTVNPATGRPYNAQGDYFTLNPQAAPLPMPAPDAGPAAWERWAAQQCFADPEHPSDTYSIHNFPDLPAYRPDDAVIVDALVVKPAPALEAADERIRPLLHRVADAAAAIDGHYRFYSYTDAAIALDPAMFGPPASDGYWTGRAAGARWCAGTRPVVCSSFLWTAVQLANAASPQISVEAPLGENPEERLASRDGLYRYTADERLLAARALHDKLTEEVREEVYLAVQELEHDNQLGIDLTQVGIAGLLALLSGPIGVLVAVLGLSPENAAALALAFNDMPDDVATQMANTFAKDRPDERDEALWAEPGEGVAVSPDDIKSFWDAPDPTSDIEQWHGLYGAAERMILIPRRQEPRRVHRYERSAGPSLVRGEVRFRGEALAGARVRLGCQTTMTKPNGDEAPFFELAASAGRYEAQAAIYWPGTQELLRGATLVRLEAGDHPGLLVIDLEEPPEWRRLIRCTGRIDTVRRVLIGSDDWSHTPIIGQEHLAWAPEDWGEPPADASRRAWRTAFVGRPAQRFRVRVDLAVTLLDASGTIEVEARSALCEHYYDQKPPPRPDQIVTAKSAPAFQIPPGGAHTFTFDHDSGNFPPDRGHVELRVENLRAPG